MQQTEYGHSEYKSDSNCIRIYTKWVEHKRCLLPFKLIKIDFFNFFSCRSSLFGRFQNRIGSIEHKCHSLFLHWWWAGLRKFFQWFWSIEHMYGISILSKVKSKISHEFTCEKENRPLHDNRSTKTFEFSVFDRCLCGKIWQCFHLNGTN